MPKRKPTAAFPPILMIGDALAYEGSQVVVSFVLGKSWPVPVVVPWNTEDLSAKAGVDYVAASGVVTFAPGETRKDVTLTLLPDSESEDIESFKLWFGPIFPSYVRGNDSLDSAAGGFRHIVIFDEE